MSQRKKKLQDAQRYNEFLRDVEDEEAWIREKEPVVSSTNLGKIIVVFPLNVTTSHVAGAKILVAAGHVSPGFHVVNFQKYLSLNFRCAKSNT